MRTICVGAGPAGLYFGILTKLRDPAADVTVLERNPEGVTYGWGVTFWDEVLDSLYVGDPVSAAAIQRSAASWGEQVVWLGNQPGAHLGGYSWAMGAIICSSCSPSAPPGWASRSATTTRWTLNPCTASLPTRTLCWPPMG